MALKEYKPGTAFPGVVGRTSDVSSPAWSEPRCAQAGSPNVLFNLVVVVMACLVAVACGRADVGSSGQPSAAKPPTVAVPATIFLEDLEIAGHRENELTMRGVHAASTTGLRPAAINGRHHDFVVPLAIEVDAIDLGRPARDRAPIHE